MRILCNVARGPERLAITPALIFGVMVSILLPMMSHASVNTVGFTNSSLYPAFDPAVRDYVIRLTNTTQVVQVAVTNSDASDTTTTVSVDGHTPLVGAFTTSLTLTQGQGFRIRAVQGATSRDYYVRSLANGFPTWGSQRPGSPQAEYFVVVPVPTSGGVGIPNRYISMYDTNGVPVWWTRPVYPHRPVDAKLLPNDDVIWTESDLDGAGAGLKAEQHRLDGSIVDDAIAPVGGYQLDAHEIQLLSNGNYLVIAASNKCCYDLSSHGGPASATIRDSIIQEVTPGGIALWTWEASDHVGIDETQQQWWSSIIYGTGSPYDVFHINSAAMDAAGNLLISLRHANAVYKLVSPTNQINPGKIIWKLSGSVPTVEPGTMLTVSGDPIFNAGGGFGGQHYARWYDAGDGLLYLTVHDNGSNLSRPPRGVRYRIDEAARTATLIEDVRDTASPSMTSLCCGSAARLPTGNWVMSWGGNALVTELTPSGSRVFVLTLGVFSYRCGCVLPGAVTREQLRAGMDVQYPRPVTVPAVVGLTQLAATNAILSANLSVGSISNAPDGTVPAGSVISQNPAAAMSAAIGSPVNLLVSSGTIPVVSQAAFNAGVFQLSVPTLSGKLYILQFTDKLPTTNWTDIQSTNGDGTVHVLTDSSATNRQRYYRVRMQ
jgi:hypothetical protein